MRYGLQISFIVMMLLCSITTFAEHRLYPANSIHCVNVVLGEKDEHNYDPIEHEYKHHPIYYHYYTGNDTVVDGKPCVMLWKYCADTPEDKELRFLCEEDGIISCKYPLAEGGYSDWKILYEFPEGGWVKGKSYIIGLFQGKPAEAELNPKPYTLLNGEETQIAYEGSLIYGIGYNNWPFLEYWEFSDFEYPSKMQPYSFYRNDTLLWGKPATYGPFFPANSVRCSNMVTSLFNNDTIYYNLYTGSDTIVDGKKCVQLWRYCTDTPENLQQSLLLEEDDKVYIKYSTSEDDEWQLLYDFSLPVWHVGDSIEHAESYRIPIESIDTITLLNGKIRQVANLPGGRLIHGMGYVDEPFFEPIYRLIPPDGTIWSPVSFYYQNKLLWSKELPKKREQRFFPANGVHTTNVYYGPKYSEDFEIIEHRDTIYYNQWTGNDTIVDGRECVVVWHNLRGGAKRFGVIYESFNGLVYFNYANDEPYSPNDWLCLYDFTPRNWKVGDMICTNIGGIMEQYEEVEKVSSVTLQNGEEVPSIEIYYTSIIYGIGYSNEPFLSPREAYNSYSGKSYPINFYRNGELLWGEEISQTDKPYLIADGLQWAKCCYYYTGDYTTVAYELRGDTILDGKSYKKEWSTHWEDLSHMELTGYFMREDAGKVYRKEGHSDEYLWFDYEANIGDTIFYDYSFVKVVGHSDTTIVCNGVSRTYRGVDVQVGYVYDSGTDYEYHLIPGYIETFYEDLGLFTIGDIVSDPSFLTEGSVTELLYVKQGDTMLYQQEEGVLWKDNTGINTPKSEQTNVYYDLQGRKVVNPTRGIYIKNGKKVLVK